MINWILFNLRLLQRSSLLFRRPAPWRVHGDGVATLLRGAGAKLAKHPREPYS